MPGRERPSSSVESEELAEPGNHTEPAGGRLVILLTASTLFAAVFVNYVISPVLPSIAQAFQVSVSRAALFVSIYGMFYASFALILGPIGDLVGRKLMIGCSLLAFAVMSLLCGVARDFTWLLVCRAGAAIAAAALQPATWAYLADYFPYERRGTAVGSALLGGSTALIVGVPLGGVIDQYLGWRWIFILSAAMSLLIAGTVAVKLPSSRTSPGVGGAVRRGLLATIKGAYGSLLSHRVNRYALLVSLLTWFAFFGQYTYVGAFLEQRFGLDSAKIGFSTLVVGIGYILGSQLGGRLSDRIGRRTVILSGLGWLALYLFLLPNLSHMPLVILAIFAMGFGFSFTYSALLTLIGELAPDARNTMMSANYSGTHIGLMAGSATLGLILAWSGFRAMGLASASACILAAVLAQWFVFRDQHRLSADSRDPGQAPSDPEA